MTCVNQWGICVLPDGREVEVYEELGPYERDTNYREQTNLELTWAFTDRYLTPEEFNEEIEVGGRTWYLHEYVTEHYKVTDQEAVV